MSFLSTLAQSMQYDNSSLYNDQYYTTSQTLTPADGAVAAAAMAMMGFFFILAIASYVVSAFLLGRIFKKAGVEPWKAWVPVYNTWVLLELGDQKGFWSVLLLIPIVNIVSVVFLIIAEYNIGLKLGKEGPFVLLAIFLPIVWLIWLAFDKSTWKGAKPVVAAPAGGAPAPSESALPKEEESVPPEQTPPTPPTTK